MSHSVSYGSSPEDSAKCSSDSDKDRVRADPALKQRVMEDIISQLKRRLEASEKKIGDLSSLIEVSKIITSTLDLDELLTLIMKTVEKVMRSEASSLMLLDERSGDLVYRVALGEKGEEVKEKFRLKPGQGIAGWVALNEKSLLVPDVSKDSRFYSTPDKVNGFRTRSIICVPMKAKGKTIGVVQAINPLDKAAFDESEMEMFEVFTSLAGIAVDNAKLHKNLLEKQRMDNELAVARQIQQQFLNKTPPENARFSLSAWNVPAWEVGGDFYDFIQLPEERIGILIGDVSGKGVPAALLMVRMMVEFRNIARESATTAEVMKRVNDTFIRDDALGMFVTSVFMVIDAAAEEASLCNAGHWPPFVIRGGNGDVEVVEGPRNLPIGVLPDAPYKEARFSLGRGDTVLLFTDGLIEARDGSNTEFTIDKLKKVIEGGGGGDAPGVVERVFGEVSDFVGQIPYHDDLTIVAAQLKQR